MARRPSSAVDPETSDDQIDEINAIARVEMAARAT